MHLKNGEREPSDDEDGIQERQYDFNNLVVMNESDGSSQAVDDENLIYETSTSDSETVYSQSGGPPPSPALARPSSSSLTVEEESAPDTTSSTSTSESHASSQSASGTHSLIENSMVASHSSPSDPRGSMLVLEVVGEILDDVLGNLAALGSDADTTIENQEAGADCGSQSSLVSNIRMHLEDLVPLESYPSSLKEADVDGSSCPDNNLSDEHPGSKNLAPSPFPSSASTLLLSPETNNAGSGLSSGRVHSPEKEAPVPIARSSPVISNLKSRTGTEETSAKEDCDEKNPSSTQDSLDLEEGEYDSQSDSGEVEGFTGVIKGIEQLQPKPIVKELEAINVSQDMFASQSQEPPMTQESHPIDEIEIETTRNDCEPFVSTKMKDSHASIINSATPLTPTYPTSRSSTSCAKPLCKVPVIVRKDNEVTPGIVLAKPVTTAEDPPALGAKRPRQDDLEENLQAAEPDRAKRKLDFRKQKKRISASQRAGLVFPVSRFNRRIKDGKYAKRSGVTAGVYIAGVLEYLVAEVAELAGQIALQKQKRRVTPRHIQLAILADEELNILTKGIIIPQGGVMPWVHPTLLGLKKKNPKDCQGKFYKEIGGQKIPNHV